MQNKDCAIPRFGIGVDIERVDRFKEVDTVNRSAFLKKIFTADEVEYCFSMSLPAQHLAAKFAGKEAVVKALASLGRTGLGYSDIEILNDKSGVPGASIRKAGHDNLQIQLSLSHSRDDAVAVAVVISTDFSG